MKTKKFLKESLKELRRVSWPNRQETFKMVMIVIGLSLTVAIFLSIFDFLFLETIRKIIRL